MKKELPACLSFANKPLLLLSFCVIVISANAQVDFRSKAGVNGNWSDTLSWEVYDTASTSWVAASLVPGDSLNRNVLIQDGTTIHLRKSPLKAIANLTVGQG